MKTTAYNIRTCLMYYYRFKRQFPCVGEVATHRREKCDVLVMTKKHMIEIEIKTSKSDLIQGEKRKTKHKVSDSKRVVNKFFVCVPTELVEEAKKWIEKTNPKYGLIEFDSKNNNRFYENYIKIIKPAKLLQPKFSEGIKYRLIRRLSSALITEYIGKITK